MEKKKILNIPNLLSVYRIGALPFIILAIMKGDNHLFITLLSVNLITDILDGLIARTFNLETEFGARLDSIADMGTYAMAFSGMILLQNTFVSEHKVAFFTIMLLYITPQIISLLKFKRPTSLHLYSSKTVAYLQGIFIFTLFLFGYNTWYFYFMMICSCIAYIEAIIIVSFTPKLRSNVRGIYFMVKEYQRIA